MDAEVSQRLCRNRFPEELRAVAVHPQMGVEGSDVADDGVQVVDVLQDALEKHDIPDDVAYVGLNPNSVEGGG